MFLTGADDGSNPALTLSLHAVLQKSHFANKVRRLPLPALLLRIGEVRVLRAWAADDAQSFKEGIADELAKLSEDVLSELLSRPIPKQ